jgi:hypothetical protein
MDDLLWLLIGLGGGVLIAVAVPAPAPTSATRSSMARRRLAVIGAGGVGALLAPRGLVMAMPLLVTDRLTTAAAALAGALWVAWTVGITLARYRPGDDRLLAPNVAPLRRAHADMPAYDATRQAMVDGLTEDAIAHDAGRYNEVGRRFAAVRGAIPDDTAQTTKLHVALRFWHSWMLARDRHWPVLDVPGGIDVAEWPLLARTIASDLALDRELSSPRVRDRFGATVPSLASLQPLSGEQRTTIAPVRSRA